LNKVIRDIDIGQAPILIFANKQDMKDCETLMTPEEVYQELQLDDMKDKREICFQGCSAKDGEGIWEGIGKL
jgi:signal recognition particle receptor subunit beta